MSSENDALVVVHTEGYPLDPDEIEEDRRQKYSELFGLIGVEIGVHLEHGKPVYFLRTMDEPGDPNLIHPAILPYYKHMIMIPDGSHAFQFLRAKESLTNDRILRPSIVGISRGLCVRDVYHLLRGEESEGISIQYYEAEAVKYDKWTRRRFNRVFNKVLEPDIIYNLTA